MGRRAKSSKGKADPKRSPARKPPKNDGARVRDLEKRLAEALEQQTATSEVLRVISSSPTDIQPVLDTLAESAARLCEAFDAEIFRRDGDSLLLVAHHGPIPSRTLAVPLVRETFNGRAVLDAHTLHVADLPSETHEFPRGSQIARQHNSRAQLSVPLMREGVAIGAISLRRTEARLFSDRQVALLQTFADQAVIAIENVRLFKELEARNRDLTETLEQQTATAEILSVISRSPTEIDPVLAAVVQNASRLCSAANVSLYRVEGAVIRKVAEQGPQLTSLGVGETRPISRRSVSGRAIVDHTTIHVADHQSEQAAREYPEARRDTGIRTTIGIPLLREGVAVGAFTAYRTESRPFSAREIALLQTFADQAVIAIENVRLFHETKDALERQTTTAEVLKTISRTAFDLQPILATLVENATRLCGADRGFIFRLDGDVYRLAVAQGATPAFLELVRNNPIRLGRETLVGRTALERRSIHIPDVLLDPEYGWTESQQRGRFRTLLGVPMLRDGSPIGVIAIWREEVRPFTDKQIELVTTFADQAVIAIENVRLFTELQEKNGALTVAHAQVSETLEQQTATSEILRTIAHAQTDAQPVFDTIVRSGLRLLGGYSATMMLLRDDDSLDLVAYTSTSAEADASLLHAFPLPLRSLPPGERAVHERRAYAVEDVESALDVTDVMRETGRARGWRSNLFVPLTRDEVAIGLISITRRDPGPFAADQIALMETFADQAVIAIENVRLFTELQTSNRDLTKALDTQTATADILGVISRSQTDVQPVFDTIIRSAVRLLGGFSGLVTQIIDDHVHLAALTSTNSSGDAAQKALWPRPVKEDVSVHGHVITSLAPYFITDVESDRSVPPSELAVARARGWRSIVAVPLLRDGRAIGSLAVTRSAPGAFADGQVALLQTFADQAVIAIENVRLFKELEARNRDLTATSEILQVIAGSPTDTQPVFESIAERALKLCSAAFGAVFRFDEGWINIAALTGMRSDELEAARRYFPRRVGPGGPGISHVARTGEVVHIPDVQADPAWRAGPGGPAFSTVEGYRTCLIVPLNRAGLCLGAINVWRREASPFSEQHIELLKSFADQAVIAIENVRLFTELTRSVEQLTALGDVGRAVSSSLDLDTVLTTIVARAVQLSSTDGGTIFEYDEAAEEFAVRATLNADEGASAAVRAARLRRGEGAVGQMAVTREPFQIPDISAEGAYESRIRGAMLASGTRSVLAIPLLHEDRLVGGLVVTRRVPGNFDAEIVELLRTFATQSALAIQNARLFREIEDKSRQLEAASQHKSEFLANMSHELRTPLNAIIGFSEVLNERMFGELNDKQAEYLKDIYASGQHLLSLINDILDLSKIEAGKMELEAADFDLPSAIDNALILIRERTSRRGITLGHSVDERLGQIRGDERKVKQVLLNLLSNALKFTPEGGRIDVSAHLEDGAAEIAVADTGVGIAPEDQEAIFEEFRQVGTADKKVEGTGLGLALSRKFIELHGGRIWVKSEVGKGSTFTFTLPVRG